MLQTYVTIRIISIVYYVSRGQTYQPNIITNFCMQSKIGSIRYYWSIEQWRGKFFDILLDLNIHIFLFYSSIAKYVFDNYNGGIVGYNKKTTISNEWHWHIRIHFIKIFDLTGISFYQSTRPTYISQIRYKVWRKSFFATF